MPPIDKITGKFASYLKKKPDKVRTAGYFKIFY